MDSGSRKVGNLKALTTGRLARLLSADPGAAQLPRLGFGCEQLGAYEWGNVDVEAIESAIAAGFERGIKLFDTADCYGQGASEQRLGRILAPVRDRVLIATKFGVRFRSDGKVYYDSSPDWAEKALYQSLARLRCDHVDLFQIHYWDGITPLEVTFEKLEELRVRGLIRSYGITNHVPDITMCGVRYPGFATVSMEYSLVERSAEAIAERVFREGMSFLSHGSLGQGILSGKYEAGYKFEAGDRRARATYRHFHGDRFERNLAIIRVLRQEAEALALTMTQLALAWIINRIPGSIPLVGIKSIAQLEEAVGALGVMLSRQTLARLDTLTRVPV